VDDPSMVSETSSNTSINAVNDTETKNIENNDDAKR
jgi:hypothetical protein